MEELMRLNSSSTGKEKLLRFHWAILSKKDGDKEIIYNLKRLETLLATVRRFLRFGRGVDLLYSSTQGISINNDSFHGFITSFARVSSTLYLLTDHLVLLRKVGLVKADERRWVDTSNRFLLLASFLFFIKNLNEIREILQIYTRSRRGSKPKKLSSQEIIVEFLSRHRALTLDAVKNLCDILVALDNVGEYRLSPVKLAMIGSLSSIAGLIQMINPAFRVMQ